MINYNPYTKEFSESKFSMKDYLKGLAVTIPVAMAINVFPKIYKIVEKRKQAIAKDKALDSKNKKMNQYFDNYAKKGLGVENTPQSQKKYLEVMQDMLGDVLNYSKYNTIEGEKNIYTTVIIPFIGFLRAILIKDMYILAGQDIGADRLQFELVFEPDPLKAPDVAKDPFRTKIYVHKWPDHGFKVTTIGQNDANELIHDTLKFLSRNPKYLTIRI